MAGEAVFHDLKLQHSSQNEQGLKLGVQNWLSELSKKLDSLSGAELAWLNKALSQVAQGLWAQKTAAFEGDEPEALGPEQHYWQICHSLKKILEVCKGINFHAEELKKYNSSDAQLPADLAKMEQEIKQIFEHCVKATNEAIMAKQTKADLLMHLFKAANILDATGDEAALQAAEGIDAVFMGLDSQASDVMIIERLGKVADLFDQENNLKVANIIDTIVKDAVELAKSPGRWESREELYDAKKHNKENMWEQTKAEVAENRKQHHLETMQGKAKTLSTRYSPELPGVSLIPVADGVYQDPVTRKIYDYNAGYTVNNEKIPGGSVKHQTPALNQYSNVSRMFDNRQDLAKRRADKAMPLTKRAIEDNDPTLVDQPPVDWTVEEDTPEYTPEQIQEMREWIKDCQWKESYHDPEFVDELSDDEVIEGVKTHYEGGIEAFLKAM